MSKKQDEVITARDLKDYVFDKGIIPTPIYTKGNQMKMDKHKGIYIVNKREFFSISHLEELKKSVNKKGSKF